MEIEQQAKEMGWQPQEEFKGNPDNWTPAEDYVRRGKEYMPFLKAEVKKLREEQKKQDEDFQLALKIQKADLEQVKKQAEDQAKTKYEDKIKALDAKESKAFEEQDTEAFKEIKKEREGLKPPDQPPVETVGTPTPEFVEWHKKNAWYGADELLTNEANAQGGVLQQINPGKPLEEIFVEVEKRIKMLYPDKFENPNREGPGEVEAGDTVPEKKANTFNDLPADAKSAYERQKAIQKEKGRDFTKEQYMQFYNEE